MVQQRQWDCDDECRDFGGEHAQGKVPQIQEEGFEARHGHFGFDFVSYYTHRIGFVP